MMYSDDFDAIEIIVNESGKIVCRFYENGKTPVVYSEKVLRRNKEVEEKREQNIESRESYEALSETEKMLFNAKKRISEHPLIKNEYTL